MHHFIRLITCLLLVFCESLLASAFDTPLSDESVREAYFLGQRHDGSVARFFDQYSRHLPPPKSGPHISSVVFLTPFAQFALFSDSYIGNYSAQQALLDHRRRGDESVKITVEIYLTTSYGSFISNPGGRRSRSSSALIPRPTDFWKDFHIQVYNGRQLLSPSDSGGRPLYRCGRSGPCRPRGGAIDLEFPASAFTSDSASIEVLPPEGEPVSVDFDLTRLR